MRNSKLYVKIISFFRRYPREYYVFAFFILFFLVIIIELFSFTVINHSYYKWLADSQQISTLKLPSSRGNIYSSNSEWKVLATSVDLNDLAIDPSVEWNKDKLSDFLTEVVYREICYLKNLWDCRNGLYRFMQVKTLPDFSMNEDYIKSKIKERINERINRDRVTSVLIKDNLTVSESFEIERLNLAWVSVNSNFLYVNPEAIWDESYVAKKLTEVLWWNYETFKHLIRKRPLRYVVIYNKLSISTSNFINETIQKEKEMVRNNELDIYDSVFPFLILNSRWHRLYPENKMASSVIWFVDSSWIWRYGIEWYFDNILRWRDWDNKVKKDILWRVIEPLSLNSDRLWTPWANITITIDRNIQKAIEDILDEDVFEYGANNINVVVMDPRNWDIISMATHPRFDLNRPGEAYELIRVTPENYPQPSINLRWARVMAVDNVNWDEYFFNWDKILLREADYEEFDDWSVQKYVFVNRQWAWVYRNHTIQDIYEPGSIFKPILMAAWIDSWEINRFDMYQDDWFVKIDQFTIRNVHPACLGYHSFNHAMNYSCNVWMIRIAQRLWKTLYHRYLDNFWFWKKTWITLEWEVSGRLDPPEKWSQAQLLTTSYWLWIWVTMLQMATAYSALANGWILYKPQIVKEIDFLDWRVVKTKSEPVRRVISAETSKIITDVLVDWVENGEARVWQIEGYFIAWKTWTAQIASRWRYETWPASTMASYAWYAPAYDPRFVIIVRVERPRTSQWWWATAWRTFNRIAEFLLDYYKIPPSR